jgi:hypothetical protein
MAIEATHLIKPLTGVLAETTHITTDGANFFFVASGWGSNAGIRIDCNTFGKTSDEAERKWNAMWRQPVRGQV